MKFTAVQKYILISPIKLRQVVSLIKKMTPGEAVESLPLIRKRAALPLQKAIKTAIANAKQKNVDASELFFNEIQVGEGPRLKRWRAGARGRAKPYKRRMSHIRVILEAKEMKKQKNKVEKKKEEKGVKNVVQKSMKRLGTRSKETKKGDK